MAHDCESQDDVVHQQYWHIAEADTPLLIDSNEKLEEAAEIISEALIVGIDCEWPPNQTGRHPSATVLQLATWSPSQGLVVLVLDLLAVDTTAASKILQTLFRRKETLKIGYSFKADVFALDMALKSSEQNGAMAIIDPIIDIAYLHRYLFQRRCPGIHTSGSGGLSGVVNANLGLPLDKSQQCSDWSCRPMALKQLQYAATDAACLVALFGYFIDCWDRRREDRVIDKVNNIVDSMSSTNKIPEFSPAQLEAAAKDWGERWELIGPGRKKIDKTGGLSQYEGVQVHFSSSKKKNKTLATLDFPAFPMIVPWMDAKKEII